MKRKSDKVEINQGEAPFFEAPDDKILAFDMFRGPSPGAFSDVDLDNPGRKIEEGMTDPD